MLTLGIKKIYFVLKLRFNYIVSLLCYERHLGFFKALCLFWTALIISDRIYLEKSYAKILLVNILQGS